MTAPASPAGASAARPLRGRLLLLARAGWVAAAGLALVVFIAGTVADVTLPDATREAVRVGLAELGVPLAVHTAYALALNVILVLGFWAVGLVLFWRRSDEPMALFTAFMLVTFGANWTVDLDLLVQLHPAWRLPYQILDLLAWTAFAIFAYVFPTGQFVPRWTRWFIIVFTSMATPVNLMLAEAKPIWLNVTALLVALVTIVFAQIYRYVRVSGPVQRQQAKWLMSGLASLFTAIVGIIMPEVIFPALGEPGVAAAILDIIARAVVLVGFLLIPLAIGIAILRYRLWEIDFLINRALVYGTLTGALLAVYFAGVVSLQGLFRAVIGQENNLAIVVATLAAAALFQPLRQRIQTVIDRRFYRRKYDAARVLAVFSASLRDEVDLNRLTAELVTVVDETMQPTSVSLWLRLPGAKR